MHQSHHTSDFWAVVSLSIKRGDCLQGQVTNSNDKKVSWVIAMREAALDMGVRYQMTLWVGRGRGGGKWEHHVPLLQRQQLQLTVAKWESTKSVPKESCF